jgi:hypothetical protein
LSRYIPTLDHCSRVLHAGNAYIDPPVYKNALYINGVLLFLTEVFMHRIKSASSCLCRSLVCFAFFMPCAVFSQVPPKMGSTPADSHMLCGKNITVEIQHAQGSYIVIGLINHQTSELDLFMSADPVNDAVSLNRYAAVKFDALSGKYVRQEESHMDVLWGREQLNGGKEGNRLVLGSHIYECGTLTAWPDETANQTYGEEQESEPDKPDAG